MSNLPDNQHNRRKQERQQALRDIVASTWKLAIFGLAGATLLVVTATLTKPIIAKNEEASLLGKLNQVLEASRYNNDLYRDVIHVTDQAVAGNEKSVAVYRARLSNKPVAAVIATVAPDGYSGNIHMLVAINFKDESIAGVRVVKHRETPGLGDKIELKRSDWIKEFKGRSLEFEWGRGGSKIWNVKKDGGQFDQFTGATITPRAVVKAVHRTLKYFKKNRQALFTAPAAQDED